MQLPLPLLACVTLSAMATAQGLWPQPILDAPIAVMSNNSTSMIEILDINGDGNLETLNVRIDLGQPSSYLTLQGRPLQGTGLHLSFFGQIPTVGSMEPFSAVGQVGTPDAFGDCALGVGQTVLVFRGGATGATQSANLTVNGAVQGVRIGDFDGDGFGDVATLTAQGLAVHRGSASNTLTTVNLAMPAPGDRQLITAEVNGDGITDLAVVDDHVTPVRFVAGAPQAQTPIAVFMNGPMPVAGDIDGDGDQDIVVFGDTTYVVLRRTGPATFVVEAPVTGGPATHLYDVDGDGDLDGACCSSGGGGPPIIMYAPSTARISINDNGVFRPAYELHFIGAWHLAGIADVDRNGTMDVIAGRAIYFSRQSLGIAPHQAGPVAPISRNTAHDLDGDGDPDLFQAPGLVRWNRGDGATDARGLNLLTPPAPGVTYAGPMIPGDFDGDGDTDLLVEERRNGTPTQMRLLLQRGAAFADGGIAMPAPFSPWIGEDTSRVVVADLDNDGRLDLIANSGGPSYWSHWWFQTGPGTFELGLIDLSFNVVMARDLDGDGRTDLLVSDSRLLLRRGLPLGGFGASEWLSTIGHVVCTTPNTFDPFRDTVGCADFDGDGRLDLILAERSATSSAWPAILHGRTGPGSMFATGPSLSMGLNPNGPVRIHAGDVTGDGIPDGIFSNPHNAGVNGVGVIPGLGQWPGLSTNDLLQQLAPIHGLVDLDGDGDLDGLGPKIVLSRGRDGATAGLRRQWGTGSSGTGGVVPNLGARGPIRVGSPLPLLTAGAAGQAFGFVALGVQTRALPMLSGISYIDPLHFVFVASDGAAGIAGDGRTTLTLPPLPASIGGLTFHLQAMFVDPAQPTGVTLTNALTLTIGR